MFIDNISSSVTEKQMAKQFINLKIFENICLFSFCPVILCGAAKDFKTRILLLTRFYIVSQSNMFEPNITRIFQLSPGTQLLQNKPIEL